MQPVSPKVFRIASTATIYGGLIDFLTEIGAGDWRPDAMASGSETVAEVAGRACYKSFGVGLNANVTKIREGSHDYIGNILRSKHGSVLEHACDTFAFVNVSRVLTHELVRHRAGTAFSQESGRFCRIDEVRYYEPEAFKDDYLNKVFDALVSAGKEEDDVLSRKAFVGSAKLAFRLALESAEANVKGLQDGLRLDDIPGFHMKKTLQSAIRRIAPEGRGNLIVMTANHRAWRHIIANRTAEGAEEEIREAIYQVYRQLAEAHPAIYQDAEVLDISYSDAPVVRFQNEKV